MNNYVKQSLYSLKNLLQIPSVKSNATTIAPFGENVKNCLVEFLNLAESLGFETVNYDNYIGEVVFGEGNDVDGLAILAHLDVVPEGDISKWTYPPYDLSFDGEYLYGRGVIDDKGAAIICLYALKRLKDEGFIPNRKIKLIVGCDEESGWGCIDYYKKVAVFPNEGFTPDGEFPVIYAEKGINHISYKFSLGNGVEFIEGGSRVNMVCDKVTLRLNNGKNFQEKLANLGGIIENNDIVFSGVSAHGSTPEKGDNAIKKALKFLVEIGEFSATDYANLFENATGVKNLNDVTGYLTFSPNVISGKSGSLEIKVDVRYPATKSLEEVNLELGKIGKFNALHYQAPLYNDKNGKLVQTLIKVYNEKTGENAEPIAIGGGTYARAIKNGVAFGISFNEDAHIPNEKQSLKNYELCFDIYYDAIKKLTK